MFGIEPQSQTIILYYNDTDTGMHKREHKRCIEGDKETTNHRIYTFNNLAEWMINKYYVCVWVSTEKKLQYLTLVASRLFGVAPIMCVWVCVWVCGRTMLLLFHVHLNLIVIIYYYIIFLPTVILFPFLLLDDNIYDNWMLTNVPPIYL